MILTETWIGSLAGELDSIQVTEGDRDDANIAIGYIETGIGVLGDGNDLAEEFMAFKNKVTGGDGVVCKEDLKDYINAL